MEIWKVFWEDSTLERLAWIMLMKMKCIFDNGFGELLTEISFD